MAILKIISHGKSNKATKRILKYVLNPTKTCSELCSVSGDYRMDAITPDTVYSEFMRIRQLFSKENQEGRTYEHGTVSFAPGEIEPDQAAIFAAELLTAIYPDHMALTAVHTDTDNVHAHFVVEPVSFRDGKLLHTTKHDLEKAKQLCNQLCKERQLRIAQKGHHHDGTAFTDGEITAWSKDKYHMFVTAPAKSYLLDAVTAIMQTLETATSRDEFLEIMQQEYGWTVTWKESRKNLTFTDASGKKARDSTLMNTFHLPIINKEGIENALHRNLERHRTAQAREKMHSAGITAAGSAEGFAGPISESANRRPEKQPARHQNHGAGHLERRRGKGR